MHITDQAEREFSASVDCRSELILYRIVFYTVTALALAFAFYTQHVWEDYYITWRSSKNLATGHGLVYNHGDRLHTFTSPLGVLLPAFASLLTFNNSDAAALWIFRVMSCLALGGAVVITLKLATYHNHARLACILIVGWLALDSKVLDFSINGMETAFLLLFLSSTLYAHRVTGPNQWKYLGASWAGLMWTRPDSFILIGLLAVGFLLFRYPHRTGANRRTLFVILIRAGLLTTALYLPWLLVSWAYYGTPVPHTITAKSGFGDPRTLAGLLNTCFHLPFTAWKSGGSLEGTFLPAYYMLGGWPEYLIQIARGLAGTAAFIWLLPFLRPETRAASFAFFGFHVYLNYFPYFAFPWYLPGTTLLAIFCYGSLLAQVLATAKTWRTFEPTSPRPTQITGVAMFGVGVILAGNIWFTWQSAKLFAAQQTYIEEGTRRKAGEWLRDNAEPNDTVFMEPLGYIGYFSGLKTYDFPGMSSREMVDARREVGNSWAKLIEFMQPQWLVLRPFESNRITTEKSDLLTETYEMVREFTAVHEVSKLDIRGRPYLEHDAHFLVYERRTEFEQMNPLRDESPFPISVMEIDGVEVIFAHAPSILVRRIPRNAKQASVQFGFIPPAYSDEAHRTDGATFSIDMVCGETTTNLARRKLEPSTKPEDRGLHLFVVELKPQTRRSRLLLRIDTGQSNTKDWTFWSKVDYE